MHLYMNKTSPFARMVRIAIVEKGLADQVETEIVDPWADSEPFMKASPAGRIPVLTTDDGTVLSEAILILRWLDHVRPEPSVWPEDRLAETLSIAGSAYNAMEAAVAILIGRKSNPDFDDHMVGRRRHRTMAEAFARLDANPPRDMDDRVDIANIATVTALDYVLFRFADRDWLGPLPRLAQWHGRQADRRSVASTRPTV